MNATLTMNAANVRELIPISEQNGKQAVSARDLHAFLESKREFATWIKDRIKKYGLIENLDYVSFDEIVKREIGATNLTQYALSLDCAKELAMVEGNAKGKQARQYFIAKEKELSELKALQAHIIPNSFSEALRLASRLQEQIELQERELKASAPKIEYFDSVLQSNSTYTMTQVAKELGMAAHKLGALLQQKGVMFYQSGQWLFYAKYQDKGYGKPRTHHYTKSDGSTGTNTITVFTEAGRQFIHSLIAG